MRNLIHTTRAENDYKDEKGEEDDQIGVISKFMHGEESFSDTERTFDYFYSYILTLHKYSHPIIVL